MDANPDPPGPTEPVQDREPTGAPGSTSPGAAGRPPRGPVVAVTSPPRGTDLVRLAACFYAALLGVALVWGLVAGRSLLFASVGAAGTGVDLTRDPALGLVAAALVILLSDRITRMTRWGEDLARELGALLGRPTLGQCVVLALMSGVAEEAFFRGALQPAIGLVGASLLFGLAHFVPRRELLPWTGFTIAAGFLLGILFDATGNLLAPIVAHVVINAVNLRILTTRHAS